MGFFPCSGTCGSGRFFKSDHQPTVLPASESRPTAAVTLQSLFGPGGGDFSCRRISFCPFDEFLPAAETETPFGVEVIRLPVGHDMFSGIFFHDQVFNKFDHIAFEKWSLPVNLDGTDLAGIGFSVSKFELCRLRPFTFTDAESVADVIVSSVADDPQFFELRRQIRLSTVNAGKTACPIEECRLFRHFAFEPELHPHHGGRTEFCRTLAVKGRNDLQIKALLFALPCAFDQTVTQRVTLCSRLESRSFDHQNGGVHFEKFPGKGSWRKIFQ